MTQMMQMFFFVCFFLPKGISMLHRQWTSDGWTASKAFPHQNWRGSDKQQLSKTNNLTLRLTSCSDWPGVWRENKETGFLLLSSLQCNENSLHHCVSLFVWTNGCNTINAQRGTWKLYVTSFLPYRPAGFHPALKCGLQTCSVWT